MKNLYIELSNKRAKEYEDFPKFFAFGEDQLQEGLKKLNTTKEDIIGTGYGGFIRKSDKKAYIDMLHRHNTEHKANFNNKAYVYDMFRYELGNHEFVITYDYENTLNALSLDMESVKNSSLLSEQLKKATKDYLKTASY